MEAVERIKDATFDINTIGLYDAEERRRQEDAMYLAYREKIATRRGYRNGRKKGIEHGYSQGISQGIEQERNSIINTMLSKGLSYDMITEITGVSNQDIKRMRR